MTAATQTRRRRKPWGRLPPAVLALVLLPFAVEAVWVFWPALQGVYLSFTQWDGTGEITWVGLGNYADLFEDPVFAEALGNTAIWLVLFGGLSFIGGLAAALFLQTERRGVTFYRMALFLPIVFSMVVSGLIWTAVFQPDGVINAVLDAVGLEHLARTWLGDPSSALYAVIVAALWRQIGYVMVLFIAGLKAIDPALLEAARIDGANSFQRLRHIILPQLHSVNLVVLCILVIDSLRSFDVVWAMTRGGPFHSSELLSTYMFSTAFQSRQLGYASAIAVVIFVLAIAFIISYLANAMREEKPA